MGCLLFICIVTLTPACQGQPTCSGSRSGGRGGGGGCHMIGVPTVCTCSEDFRESSAHAFISEMGISSVLPCRENNNNWKWVGN